MNSSDLMRSLKESELNPVYLFQGNDTFLQKFLVDKIAEKQFGDEPKDITYLLPDEMGGQEIIDRLTSMDLFSSRKMFVLRKPGQLHVKWQNALVNYCTNPVNGHILVTIEEDMGRVKAVVTKLKKVSTHVIVTSPFESELRKWAVYFFKSNGLSVSGSVINAIIEIAGDSIHHLFNEIEKIATLHDGSSQLTVKDVRKFSGWKREHWRWEFLMAIGSRDINRSLTFGSALIKQNETLLQLVYPLTSLFTEIYFTKLGEGTSGKKRSIPFLTPGVSRRIQQYAKKYTLEDCERILDGLGTLDRKLKSEIVHDDSEFANFIFGTISTNGK